ncbi:MAG: pyruvate kinase, partial [Gammaproteobacteria bacterium]
MSSPAELVAQVRALIERAREFETAHGAELDACAPAMRASALNLVHYLALRQVDLRPLQTGLRALGLSSLGRMEGCVMASLGAVLGALERLAGEPVSAVPGPMLGFEDGARLLRERSTALFGVPAAPRDVRIMVTMPSEAAADAALVEDLVAAGMDVMRVNAAHDDSAAWRAMIGHLRAVGDAAAHVRVSLDLAGPKLRTGPAPETIEVMKLRPRKGPRGEIVAPLRLRLGGGAAAPELPLPPALCKRLRDGDRLELRDARG